MNGRRSWPVTENTRAGIFDALDRREVYARGVPMGGDLIKGEGAPSLLVFAMRDPNWVNLDCIQIVKGWVGADGATHEKAHDVVWAGDRQPGGDGKLPTVGNIVDLTIPNWTNDIGRAELGTVWSDPHFDASENAFYSTRVIEIPTPRWSAHDAVRFNVDMPPEIKMITWERAYSSPIGYTPNH